MKTILLIDDDRLTARVYQSLLEKAGHRVHVANDGLVALKQYEALRPDGVLLDLMLPGLSGVDVLAGIRALDKGATVPIIVVTNAAIPELFEKATQARATAIFSKSEINGLRLREAFRTAWENQPQAQP